MIEINEKIVFSYQNDINSNSVYKQNIFWPNLKYKDKWFAIKGRVNLYKCTCFQNMLNIEWSFITLAFLEFDQLTNYDYQNSWTIDI